MTVGSVDSCDISLYNMKIINLNKLYNKPLQIKMHN